MVIFHVHFWLFSTPLSSPVPYSISTHRRHLHHMLAIICIFINFFTNERKTRNLLESFLLLFDIFNLNLRIIYFRFFTYFIFIEFFPLCRRKFQNFDSCFGMNEWEHECCLLLYHFVWTVGMRWVRVDMIGKVFFLCWERRRRHTTRLLMVLVLVYMIFPFSVREFSLI